VKIVHNWLAEMAPIPGDVETVAREISLRGFEVADVANGVIDFEITANRPDCLSHVGMAREAHAIWGFRPPSPDADIQTSVSFSDDRAAAGAIPVSIEAPDLCPRYAAQVFDVKVGPSPSWMVERLEAAGVRSINNIVDITNYVMLEVGQPMHAFDLERLHGGRLVIRRARTGETLRTLDGVDRALDPEMLVIADAERAVALGGVMGGHDSEISSTTTRMVMESAFFHPASVRRTSRRLGLKSEASIRFERGADIDAPLEGLAHAARLLREMGAGTAGAMVDVYPEPRQPLSLRLRASRIERVLGVHVPSDDVERILTRLGFFVEPDGNTGWAVTIPTFRVDVTREIDLIEEVGRHFGFDNLPVTFPTLGAAQPAPDLGLERDRRTRAALAAAGFSESMTFAFIERAAAEPFCDADTPAAAIANPLSEKFAVLRPSLLPGLIDSASHNRRRGRKDVRLFETGSRFGAAGEGRAVGLVWSGAGNALHWSAAQRTADFFDMKGAVELLCVAHEIRDVAFAAADAAFLVRGRAAEARSGAARIGVLGQVLPSIAEARGFPPGEEVYVAEVDLDALASRTPGGELRTDSLPRFPSIVRDVSILVDEALPAAAVRGTIRSSAPQTLHSIVEFDRYQGKGIPEGRVSLSLRLTFRSPDRTLTDDEVDAALTAIVETLQREHAAERR
jgi:phenylalanyl-tRNA synthetase beta chain